MRQRFAEMPRSLYLSIVGFWSLVCVFNFALAPSARGATNKVIAVLLGLGSGTFVVLSVWYRRGGRSSDTEVGAFGRQYGELSTALYLTLITLSATTTLVMLATVVFADTTAMKAGAAVLALIAAVFLWTAILYRRKWVAR